MCPTTESRLIAQSPSSRTSGRAGTGIRLAKKVAELAACSRREAELYIAGGWVRVDGQVVEDPAFRVAQQVVVLDKNASLMDVPPVTVLLHKPPGYDDGCEGGIPALRTSRALLIPANRSSNDDANSPVLKRHFSELTAHPPLELAAGGLLVFTQDWRVARKLIEDAAVIEHEVIIEVQGEVAPAMLARLNHGLSSDGHPLPPVKVSLNSSVNGKSRLRFAVKGSHPGLLAYLCERVRLKVLSMKRIRVGRVLLGGLPMGQWRYLQARERF